MCADPAKFQQFFWVLGLTIPYFLNFDGQKVTQSEHVKLLGVQIDNKLHFDMHAKELY